MHLDPASIIKATGYLGIFIIVFVESGLLVGFLLPGDSLLFTAGFLASQGFLDIAWLLVIIFVAAVLGDSTGYSFGRRFGPKVFKRQNSLVFSHNHIARSQAFYQRHGGKTIILARFLPVVRSFAPVLAGVGKMPYRTFLTYNLVGAFIWSFSLTLLGYWLGKSIPNIDKYLLPAIALIVLASVLPSAIHLLKDRQRRQQLRQQWRDYRKRRQQRRA